MDDLDDKLRQHFRRTSTDEVNLKSGHKAFLSATGQIFIHKDGGSVELSLADDATREAVRAALPVSVEDIKNSQAYRDLSPNAPDAITQSQAYRDLSGDSPDDITQSQAYKDLSE